jgi:tetratricopeptide (TPR) repeat protein
VRLAIQSFEQAIKIDPQYALAFAGLADCYAILRVYAWISAEEGRPKARAAMTRAVALAPASWEANFSHGFYFFYFERDWRQAEPHLREAIAINPRSSLARMYYAMFLSAIRRADEALEHAAIARQLDPLSPFIHACTALVHFALGRFEDAERAAHQSLELQPDYLFGLWQHGLALTGLERHAEAIQALERAVALSNTPIFVGMLGLGYARAGRRQDAERLFEELENRSGRGEYVAAFITLSICVGLGELGATEDIGGRVGRGHACARPLRHQRPFPGGLTQRS